MSQERIHELRDKAERSLRMARTVTDARVKKILLDYAAALAAEADRLAEGAPKKDTDG